MFYPIVRGIVATDLNGYICDGNGNLITETADELTRKLDRQILRSYIKNLATGGTLFVVGENTYKNMGGQLRGMINAANVVVSNEDEAKHLGEEIKYNNEASKQIQLMNYVFQVSLKRNMNIVVLGGKSVYQAFKGHYAELTHCMIKTDVVSDGKKIQVLAKDLSDRNSLIFSRYPKGHIPIDNEVYKVTVYQEGLQND